MSVEKGDRLRRFDDVFRTLLIIAGFLVSVFLAVYRALLPTLDFWLLVVFFAFSLCVWVVGTLLGEGYEVPIKAYGWWALALSLTATSLEFIYYPTASAHTKSLLPICAIATFLLSYPIIWYFKDLTDPDTYLVLKIALIISTLVVLIIEVV